MRLDGLHTPAPVVASNKPTRPTTETAEAFTTGMAKATDWSSDATINKHGITVLLPTHWVPSAAATAGVPATKVSTTAGMLAGGFAGTAGEAGVIEPAAMNGENSVAGTSAAGTAATAATAGEIEPATTAGEP